MYKQGTNITRKEIKQEIISNDPHSKNQQDWTLELKKKKTSPHPRCRACRRIQNENELTVNKTGSMSLLNRISLQKQCFFSETKMHKHIPNWTTDRIRANRSISDVTIAALKDNALPL